MTRTRIKFCGMTAVADALAAAELGVDAVGLIFVPESPRALDFERAARIANAMPPLLTRVGLFRNASVTHVRQALAHVAIDVLQFHGDETPEFCTQFGRSWMKAVPMGALPDADAVDTYIASYAAASGLVFDSHGGARSGGSGAVFDWLRLPRPCPRPVILAGGLNPENVADAVRQVRPWAVDVSSGIESAPGIKDHAKMRVFVNEVYRAGTD
jgi:phosphoribosylanthranilate isomerase